MGRMENNMKTVISNRQNMWLKKVFRDITALS